MLTNYPNGVSSFGVPLFGGSGLTTTGTFFFVDSATGSDNNDGLDPARAFATITQAISRTTASVGDIIIAMPGHAETRTAAITLSTAGVKIVGLGWGRLRPAITRSGSIDLFDVTAANCWIENIRGVSTATTGGSMLNIGAADLMVENCVFEHGTGPLFAVTVPAAGSRFHINNSLFLGTAAGPDVAIEFEGSALDWKVTNTIFNYAGSSGLDLAGIRSSFQSVGGYVNNCQFIAMDLLAIDFNSSVSAQGDGLISNVEIAAGAGLTSIEDILDVGGYNFVNVKATDVAASAGATVPVATAS